MLAEAEEWNKGKQPLPDGEGPPPVGSRSWQEFMDERAEKFRNEGKAVKENLSKIGDDLKAINGRLHELEKLIKTEVKPWSKMTGQERHRFRQDYIKANPDATAADIEAHFRYFDLDPDLAPGQMVLYVAGETLFGLPAATGQAMKNTLKGYWENAGFMGEFMKAYGEDVASGAQFERLATARVFDYFTRPGQLLKDLQDMGQKAGTASIPLEKAVVERVSATVLEMEQALMKGDAPKLAKAIDKLIGDQLGEELFSFGMGKVSGLSKAAMGGLAAKVRETVTSSRKAPDVPKAKPTKSNLPSGKPKARPPQNMADAAEGTVIDSAAKANQYGVTPDEIKKIDGIADQHNVIIETRASNVDRVRHLGSAHQKPEHIKTKTINAADTELGFRRKDTGLAGALTDDMYTNLNGMKPDQIAKLSPDAQARRLERIAEYKERAPDLAKLEHGVKRAVPEPGQPGWQKRETLRASRDDHGVIRAPDGKGFTGDIDLHDIRHADGRAFGHAKDGRVLGYDSRGRQLRKGSPEYDADWKVIRADREKMTKIMHDYKEKLGGQHGGGYWNPKAGLKFDENDVPTIDCKNLDVKARVDAEAAEGKGVLRFGPGEKPQKAFGTGKSRYGGNYRPGPKGASGSWKGGYKPEYRDTTVKSKSKGASKKPGGLKPKIPSGGTKASGGAGKASGQTAKAAGSPKPPSGGKKK